MVPHRALNFKASIHRYLLKKSHSFLRDFFQLLALTLICCHFIAADLGIDPVSFALLDSEGHVIIWDSRKYSTPLHQVDTGLKNTRGDSIQIEVGEYIV